MPRLATSTLITALAVHLPLFLGACGEGSSSGSDSPPKDDLDGARAAFQRGSAQVQEHLEAPDHATLQAAIDSLEESVRLAPNEIQHRLMAGRTQELALNSEAALAHYRIATGLGHEDPLVWRRMGNLALGLGDMDMARGCFERALSQQASDPELFFGYGCLLDLEGEFEAARQAFDSATAIRPTYDDAYFRLAKVLRVLGDETGADAARAQFDHWNGIDHALAEARKHVRMHPEDAHGVRAVGLYLFQLQRAEECTDWLQRAKKMLPRDATILECLGRAQSGLGRVPAARANLELAVECAPGSIDPLRELAFVLAKGGDVEGALERMAQALALAPGDADLHFQNGVLLMQLQRPDAALEAYALALVNDPNLIDAHLGQAEVHYGANRREEAIAAYRRVLAIDPTNAAATGSLNFIQGEGK
ncbi:MAG TPA: tetratricopeptide repeat protein [Planctomycetes bacterium]|nr:tetratricopeptide repeat protein [Planctomycetota bacterium]